MTTIKRSGVLWGVLALFACATQGAGKPGSVSATKPSSLTGYYAIRSASNPGDNGSYSGSVIIVETDGRYRMKWDVNGASYDGVGLFQDGVLAAAWATARQNCRLTVYSIRAGTLEGRSVQAGSDIDVEIEVFEGAAELRGTYRLVSGRTASSKTDTGDLSIVRTGSTYALLRNIVDTGASGVGILEGSTLVVGWGGCGPLVYTPQGATLLGKWATPGGTELGSEILVKE